MGTKVISALTAVTAGNLTGAAVFPVDDATTATRKATLAQLRTNLLAGGTGFTATDPLQCGTLAAGAGTFTAFTQITGGGMAVTGGVHVITGGIAVDAGTSAFGDAIRQFGSNVARFENTFGGLPTGATGTGVEIGVAAGPLGRITSFDRTGGAFAALALEGATVRLLSGPVLVGTTISTSAVAGNVVLPNGVALRSVNGAGTDTIALIDADASNHTRLQLNSTALALNNPQTAASATAGAATALPANPVGYLILTLNGTTNKIPYYAN